MSSIRVNPYPLPDLLAALSATQQQQNTASLNLATGSRINKPSDDPAGAAQMVSNTAQTSQADTFLRSISSVTGLLHTADSTLSSVVTGCNAPSRWGLKAPTELSQIPIAVMWQPS